MGFSSLECWSWLPCPSPGFFPIQGSNVLFLWLLHWQVGSLPLVPPGKPPLRIHDLFRGRWPVLKQNETSESFFFSIQQWSSNWALNAWGPPKASTGTDKMVLEVTCSRFAIFKCVFFYKIDLYWKHLEAASQFSFPSLLPHSLHILKKKRKMHYSATQRMQQTQGAQQRSNWKFYVCRASMNRET